MSSERGKPLSHTKNRQEHSTLLLLLQFQTLRWWRGGAVCVCVCVWRGEGRLGSFEESCSGIHLIDWFVSSVECVVSTTAVSRQCGNMWQGTYGRWFIEQNMRVHVHPRWGLPCCLLSPPYSNDTQRGHPLTPSLLRHLESLQSLGMIQAWWARPRDRCGCLDSWVHTRVYLGQPLTRLLLLGEGK